MDDVVAIANRLTDMDWGWWPFLYLRPRREERMTARRVAVMALHFGPLAGVIIGGLLLLRDASLRPSAVPILVGTSLISTLLFFPFYLFTFARCWNVRAAALKGEVVEVSVGSLVLAVGVSVVSLIVCMSVGVAMGARAGRREAEARRQRQTLDYEAWTAAGRADGERWVAGHTQADCLAEGLRRDAPCHRIACKVPTQAFVEVCLARATPTPGLCDGVRPPADDEEDTRWREERCRQTHPEAVRECFNFIPLLQLHCTQRRPARVGTSSTVALRETR